VGGEEVNFASLTDKTEAARTREVLAPRENPFSTNKVTGHSLNYPIVPTCSPTKVCVKTCYFGCGPSTWPASLAKQWRLYNATVADPAGTARRIVEWTRRLKLTFVRWNGGGDLFAESVECINQAAPLMPDVPQWVVTRLPEHARAIEPAANVFVHFSVDRHSWGRLEAMRGYAGNWFWSYQCDAGEKPAKSLAPVVFYDHYDPGDEPLNADDCPLNATSAITGVCGRCRRCFDGSAVARAKEMAAA
jgi:hypothetical protein